MPIFKKHIDLKLENKKNHRKQNIFTYEWRSQRIGLTFYESKVFFLFFVANNKGLATGESETREIQFSSAFFGIDGLFLKIFL